MEYGKAILLTICLSFDVFFANLSMGIGIRRLSGKKIAKVSAVFAIIQGIYATIAYQLEEQVAWILEYVDHWISFVTLAIIGTFMILRSYHDEEMDQKEGKIQYLYLFFISLAVCIDVLAIPSKKTFSELSPYVGVSILVFGAVVMTIIGIVIGHRLGSRYRYKSEFIGGILLVILAIKMLLVGVFRR